MHMMQGKKIILGITGSIAAYKSILLLRLLKKAGAEVKVVMTPSSREFVSPLVLSTLSGSRAVAELTDGDSWENHVALGRWADLLVIAPLSCNSLSAMANGQCNNLLLATYLSATCPVMIAPAMDTDMWHHPATVSNMEILRKRGHLICPVSSGELASGLVGDGRMAEPEFIFEEIAFYFQQSSALKNKKALVTAGPTYENIDPVRFIGNHSSGKMGIEIASALARRGAEVTLVLGPSSVQLPPNLKDVIRIQTAADMLQVCLDHAEQQDILIMAAAVADYRPANAHPEKIKKTDDFLHIDLEKTTDILQTLGKNKKQHQILIGFALETEKGEFHAIQKLENKGADAIILNSLEDPGAGFAGDTNKITIFEKGGKSTPFPLKSKREVASDIAGHIQKMLNA
jgi:phosphopantothenoylcysteine decarboxylase/phosphopantothenate--cysteine ligase